MARNVAEVAVRWTEGLQFEGGGAGRPPVRVDGNTQVATSPVELLLVSAATCAMSDVVIILEKQRVKLRALEVAMRGTRRETEPRRLLAIHFAWTIAGEGADEGKARRAIDLSIEKYCSVVASLAPDIAVSYDVAIAA
ncbi:MAG: OsmC family protein [Gemmatimonadetes bacterium]|nr:OsmC family protein [Gemmatimonadota bacterium]